MIIHEVTFVTIWTSGYKIERKAKYDALSAVVFDIEEVEIDWGSDKVQDFEEDYILLPNGGKLDVSIYNDEYRTRPPMFHSPGDLS